MTALPWAVDSRWAKQSPFPGDVEVEPSERVVPVACLDLHHVFLIATRGNIFHQEAEENILEGEGKNEAETSKQT